MIRLNVDEQTLETGVGLERVVQQIFWYQVFYKDAIGKNIRLMKLQMDMYNAKNGERIAFLKKANKTEAYYIAFNKQGVRDPLLQIFPLMGHCTCFYPQYNQDLTE